MASYWDDGTKQYFESVNRPDMPPESATIIHDPPSAPGLVQAQVPFWHWKIVGGDDVGEMTAQEKLAVDRYADNFEVETPQGGKTSKIEWFETDEGEGVYSGLARDELWTWSGGKLQSKVAKSYHKDGSTVTGTTETTSYYTTGDGKKVTKVVA